MQIFYMTNSAILQNISSKFVLENIVQTKQHGAKNLYARLSNAWIIS